MKITAIRAVLGLSFYGSAKGRLDAIKPNRAVLGSFESTQMGTLGHTKVFSEALEVSNFQRKLGSIAYENGCESATGADRCCDTPSGCSMHGDHDIVIPQGTCVGNQYACAALGDFTVGEYSCVGETVCFGIGYLGGSATVASNSCKGGVSCLRAGAYLGEATIGSNSCITDENIEYPSTCMNAGAYSNNKVTIGDDSCVGENACFNIGSGTSTGDNEVEVGNYSCRGWEACKQAGSWANEGYSEVFIGDGSCNGNQACIQLLNYTNGPTLTSFPPARIGTNSCNCDMCCKCLVHGDIVPDNSCNSIGSDANECCSGTNYERNEIFDFRNENGNPVTDPTPPGTTTAFVAPAEFDVTLSTSPGCAFTAGTDNIGTITCTFDTKGAADYTVDSELYSADCSTAGAPTGVSLDTTSFNHALISGTQYESAYVVTLLIANSAAATGSTSIAFCLKTEVKDKKGDVYDWTEQKITKPIDVIGDFSTDSLSTETFNGGEATDKELEKSSFGVGINRCDENGVEVSNGAALAVGENIFLCVKGIQSQVAVSSIGKMTAAKSTVSTLSIVTEVGDGSGEGTSNSNTFVYGNGQNQVVIATRLPATFFASSGAVTFSGSANIVIARRRLSRSIQVASASSEESANFSMDIQVAGMDDASSASAIKTTAAMFFAAAVVAMIV